jgi:hypothetical protein
LVELFVGDAGLVVGFDFSQYCEELLFGVDGPPVPGDRHVVVGGWRGVLDGFGQLLEGKDRLRTLAYSARLSAQ